MPAVSPASLNTHLRQQLDQLDSSDLYRRRRVLESPQGTRIIVSGRALLNFASNDYLGLANDSRVIAAFKQASDDYGVGSGASHLVSGHSQAHQQLERALAEFTGRQRALVFANGYAANMAVIRALVSSGDEIYQDRLNHASLLDGGWLSRAAIHWFEHGNYRHLQQLLNQQQPSHKKQGHQQPGPQRQSPQQPCPQPCRLIVSDGVFSMDGDSCDLPALIELAQIHQVWLMIDDAHGIGVLGDQGCGSVDSQIYTSDQVPILIGTLGKAFGTSGAFVAGSEELIEWLIQKARNYIYSTASPPALAAASLASLRIVQTESWRRQHLRSLINRFIEGAQQRDLPLLPSTTPIQPLLLNDSARCLAVSAALEQRGIFARAIRPPTVPVNSARIRLTLSAAHTENDINQLLTALDQVLNG